MKVICNACKAKFNSNYDFNNHAAGNCPATPPCKEGESWEDYSKRCDVFAAEWSKNKKR